jgi:hypothetical protein
MNRWLVAGALVVAGCQEPPSTETPLSPPASAPEPIPFAALPLPVTSATAIATATASASVAPPPVDPGTSWKFDDQRRGASPAGFTFAHTGGGAEGSWLVFSDDTAPTPPHVLAQLANDDTEDRYLIAVTGAPPLADLRFATFCKPLAGKVERACGLVFRYRDAANYYLARADAVDENVRLYVMAKGRRRELASWSGPVIGSGWLDCTVEVRGDHIEVTWNGSKVIDHHDATLAEPGRVGLWTRADSITYFDNLHLEAL